ncbi:hypothetical protein HK100_005756 [Physocladia obscura]|uniref:Uncharacterized protein n=1 Tax=Physocladia obscura TaxID=109957 RepID=A0AAD5T6D3_9FUNG|nr:hypothetical protein HK100_005756 [Physocladia obscura]
MFTELLHQRHSRCSLARTGATTDNTNSDVTLTLAFAATYPMVNITHACAVRRIKCVIYEDYNNGAAAEANVGSAFVWDGPQIGVIIDGTVSLHSLIVSDNIANLHSDDLTALFDEAKIPVSTHKADEEKERVRKIGCQLNRAIGFVPDIENSIQLLHPSTSTDSESNLLIDTEKLDHEKKKKDVVELGCIGASLKSAVVFTAAILEGFVRYSSGLDDVATEDGDSEWKSEYDEDDVEDDIDELLCGDDDDGDSSGYATDY